MNKCDKCGHYHEETPIECDISEYAYLTMDESNECKQFALEAGTTSEEPDIRVYLPGKDEHPMCTCCSTKVGVLRISFGTKGQKHSYVGIALCDRCRKELIAKLMGG